MCRFGQSPQCGRDLTKCCKGVPVDLTDIKLDLIHSSIITTPTTGKCF